ncbi:MAG: hypothetical protein CM1200mP2_40650 [Planctomycetaceae bacterium]|nr:MAG: hypothetical protein CM1200mP2_40650 [Planctomycetaceae bacterium]
MLGIDPGGVRRVELAGGFAESIESGPPCRWAFWLPSSRSCPSRGKCGVGRARQLLLDVRRQDRVQRLVERIEHIELETTEDFFEVFTEACQFKPMQL